MTDDDLDNLLAPPPAEAAALPPATLGVLWRRRWGRRGLTAGALAAAFAAGALFWPRPAPTTTPEPTVAHVPAPRPVEPLSPPPSLVQRLRSDGDALAARGDYAGALRYYREALDAGTPADREVSADDNWLLIALKHDFQKETDHATLPR